MILKDRIVSRQDNLLIHVVDVRSNTVYSFPLLLFFRVSLESRDPLDSLVSVDPPDLLDPLDCLVPAERLVVR